MKTACSAACVAVLTWCAAGCASSNAGRPAVSGPPPPIFAGTGAVIGAPREQALPADGASVKADPAQGGPCAAPAAPSDVALVDDFEDGDAAAFKAFQREGWWFAAADGTEGAKLLPERGTFRPERLPVGEGSRDNLFAAHLAADGQKDWGAVFGVTLRWHDKGIRCPLNASTFAGVRFRAKGPGTVRVAFGVPETEPADGGGTCSSGCYDVHGKVVYLSGRWEDYLVRWDRLEQQGWGTEARFDPARVVTMQLAVKPQDLPIDFWIDDVAFVTEPEAVALAAVMRSQPPPAIAPARDARPRTIARAATPAANATKAPTPASTAAGKPVGTP